MEKPLPQIYGGFNLKRRLFEEEPNSTKFTAKIEKGLAKEIRSLKTLFFGKPGYPEYLSSKAC